ncbi:hypothetical protein SAMN03080602_01456 [Arenibacter troitsensis]|uniref:Uncharacterized protein n=2 Tax=Arenibacter troitsensis TaxID=188872 RepID=A0A1X7J7C8_9FLAO|nr:hypothetical protein SAMN03080602_01456 [Arenibacter troitsensis]
MLILIILASLIPGALAVVQYIENEKKEKVNKDNEQALNVKIDNLQIDNSELKENLRLLSSQNTDLKKDLKLLSADNAKLSHQLTNTTLKLNESVIGSGDLEVHLTTNDNNEFKFKFVNNSDLPVFNTIITIQNYNEIIKCEVLNETPNHIHIKKSCYDGNFNTWNGIAFNPKSSFVDDVNLHPITNDYMNYSIIIQSRKKYIVHNVVIKKIKGQIRMSNRIYDLVNDTEMVLISENDDLGLSPNFWKENFHEKSLFTVD